MFPSLIKSRFFETGKGRGMISIRLCSLKARQQYYDSRSNPSRILKSLLKIKHIAKKTRPTDMQVKSQKYL